ncbi:hypothetical protein WJX74_002520 [Apatococcus lobatus]|uniref:Glycosyl hydrolase family 13 catalytic domain-containing protein n=1 Tax=Apatococcus lobatus TaxID=904363 RepID=A0AAW1RWA9_9CHLO
MVHLHSFSADAGLRALCLTNQQQTDLKTVKWVSETVDVGDNPPGVFAPISEGLADHQGVRNQIQLSTYAHHIGNNLTDLYDFMEKNLQGAVGGLHLLPFYPSSGDGGFAPITYKEVDPEKGTWSDIDRLAKKYDLMVEFMVNHISPASQEFQDFLAKGPESEFWPMFIHWNEFWGGEPTLDDLERIRTRKPEAPVLTVDLKSGGQEKVWCTFSPQQIDINVSSKQGEAFIRDQMKALCSRGARLVRLDAFGYATKKRGTSCFFQEPEVWKVLDLAEELANATDTRMLCEVHESYQTNISLAERGYWVYDFALPLLILHAFTFHTAKNLRRWLSICPKRQITVLDTHDGMGIDDISGLAEVADVDELAHTVECTLGCDPNFKYIFNKHTQKYESRPHQFNCTYFSAVGRAFPQHRERMYLMARVIQFFTPGIPMIYYVGLLAGENDLQAMRDSLGSSRGINRHRYSINEAEQELQRPVVQALLELCRFRNSHPAFNGETHVNDEVEDHLLEVSWRNGEHKATLYADLRNLCFHSDVTMEGKNGKLELRRYEVGEMASPPTSGTDDMQSSQRPAPQKQAFADV